MKLILTIVLVCFSFSTVPLVNVDLGRGTSVPSIVTLDVCHASFVGMQMSSDPTFIHECPCKPFPIQLSCPHERARSAFRPFLIAFQEEHPPEL
jgi:hypothetical protein